MSPMTDWRYWITATKEREGMRHAHFMLHVGIPDEIDSDTWAEIVNDSEPHDGTDLAKIERWLGGFVQESENTLRDNLPEGWSTSWSNVEGDK